MLRTTIWVTLAWALLACNGEGAVVERPKTTTPPSVANLSGALRSEVDDIVSRAGSGTVRVIVEATSNLDDPADVARASDALASAAKAVGVEDIDPIDGEPMAVMTLTGPQLKALAATGLLEAVSLDQPRRAQ